MTYLEAVKKYGLRNVVGVWWARCRIRWCVLVRGEAQPEYPMEALIEGAPR